MNQKLKVGDKYLSIKLVGHDYVRAYKNIDKKNPKAPDYQGDGVSVWISVKKESKDGVRVSSEDLE
jgi:hypothetical protein